MACGLSVGVVGTNTKAIEAFILVFFLLGDDDDRKQFPTLRMAMMRGCLFNEVIYGMQLPATRIMSLRIILHFVQVRLVEWMSFAGLWLGWLGVITVHLVEVPSTLPE